MTDDKNHSASMDNAQQAFRNIALALKEYYAVLKKNGFTEEEASYAIHRYALSDEDGSKDNQTLIAELAEVMHRVIVILDDFLCRKWGFSRRPRGKYEREG